MENPSSEERYLADRLLAPFGISEHEQHPTHKYFFIKEESINIRLTEVFGMRWSKYHTAPYQIVRPGEYGTLPVWKDKKIVEGETKPDNFIVIWPGGIEANGVKRESVGIAEHTKMGGTFNEQLMNTIKSADTDILKRCARQFGVGLYLTMLGTSATKIETFGQLKAWLYQRYPNDLRFWDELLAMSALVDSMASEFPLVFGSTATATKTELVKLAIRSLGIVWSQDSIYEVMNQLRSYASGITV